MLATFRAETKASAPLTSVLETKKTEVLTPTLLLRIRAHEQAFARATGKNYTQEEIVQEAYYPPLDRAFLEELRSHPNSSEEARLYEQEIRKGIVTTLAEYCQAQNSTDNLRIIAGQLCSERYSLQSIGNLIQRGIEWRKLNNSADAVREESELVGWNYINDILTAPNTPIGTKILSLSRRSGVPNSPYKKQVIDEFTLKENGGQKFVFRDRFLVDLSDSEYEQLALQINPKFFENYDNRPKDAWLIAHPAIANIEIPEDRKIGMSVDEFEEIERQVWGLIETHFQDITAKVISWPDAIESWNNLINQVDILRHKNTRISMQFNDTGSDSGPCGHIGSFGSVLEALTGSVAQFGDKACVYCPYCEKKVEIEQGPNYIECTKCRNRKYN